MVSDFECFRIRRARHSFFSCLGVEFSMPRQRYLKHASRVLVPWELSSEYVLLLEANIVLEPAAKMSS
jgi:hypothetical protein